MFLNAKSGVTLYDDRNFIADPRKETVKRSWDFYGNDGKKLKTHNKGNSIPRNDGKWESGFLTGRAIGNDEWDGKIKKIKVPVGTWATVSDSPVCSQNYIAPNDNGTLNVYWGIENNKENNKDKNVFGSDYASIEYGNKLNNRSNLSIKDNENIATKCANTKDLTNKPDEYKKGDEECYVSMTAKDGKGNCVRSGLHLGSYCQLGDNISSQICKEACDGVQPNEDPKNDGYCIWAKERLCNKGIDDTCKGDTKCGKHWVTDKDTCTILCGDPESPNKKCTIGWMNYCSDPAVFQNPENNCQGVLQKIQENNGFNLSVIKETCKDNIFTGKCKNLCTLEPNQKDTSKMGTFDEWCTSQKKNFCSDPKNLTTQECLEFSKLNPDIMKKTLVDFCTNVKELEDMNKPVSSMNLNTGKRADLNMSNWCGCLAPEVYYTAYEKNVEETLNLKKFELSGIGLLGNRACYGECNIKGAPIPSGYSKDCPICIQTIINNIGKLDKSKIQQEQIGDCVRSIREKKDSDVKPPGGDVKPQGGDVKPPVVPVVPGGDVKPPVVPVVPGGDVKPPGGDVKPPGGDVNVNNWKYLLIMLIVLVIIFGFMFSVAVYTKKPIQPFMMSMFKGFKF